MWTTMPSFSHAVVFLLLLVFVMTPDANANTIDIGFMGDTQDARSPEVYGFARLALSIINTKGSPEHNELLSRLNMENILPAHTLNFVRSDSKCNRAGGVQAALIQTNSCGSDISVVASVGAGCSSASIGSQDLFRYSTTPQISYAATSPLLSDSNQYPYFGRTVPPDNQQARALLAFLQSGDANGGGSVRRAGVISFDDAYTKGIADAFRDFSPQFGVAVPLNAKGVIGYMTHSVYEGVKQVHGDLRLVCRLREMDAAGIRHMLIATRADYLLYYISAILQTGYLAHDTQLYITETFYHIRPGDNWGLLETWQVWYTGHGSEPLNGWWSVPGTDEPVPMYVKEGSEVHTLDATPCVTLIGSVDRSGADTVITVDGRTAVLREAASPGDATTLEWSDGVVWSRRPHFTREDYLEAIMGIVGTGFQSAGRHFHEWFIPDVYAPANPADVPDMDGDRSTVTGYSTASFDATLAIALGIDKLIKSGLDYNDGPLLFSTIRDLQFEGISGPVSFDTLGDRANSTYDIFNYNGEWTKQTVATVAGSLDLTGVQTVYARGSSVPISDGACAVTNSTSGAVCGGVGTCMYGTGTCVCDAGFLGNSCEIRLPPLCADSDFVVTVGECTKSNTRPGSYAYVSGTSSACCNIESFPGAPCASGRLRPLSFTTNCDYVHEESDVGVAYVALGALGVGAVLLLAVIVVIFRDSHAMLKGQPPFLVLCCVGGAIGLATLIVYPGEWTTARCRLIAALPNTGFTVIMTSIVLKAWRVDTIFNNKSLHLMKVGGVQMLNRFFIIFVSDTGLLLLFLLVNNLHASTHEEEVGGRILPVMTCTADAFYFGFALLISKLCLMFYGVVLALRVRNVAAEVAESRFIVYSIYNIALVTIVGGYLYLFGEMDVERSFQAFGVCSLLLFTMPPAFMVIPRLRELGHRVSPRRTSENLGARTNVGMGMRTTAGMLPTGINLSTKSGGVEAWDDVANCRATAADNLKQPNDQLYEMLAEQQEEIRNLKVLLASKPA